MLKHARMGLTSRVLVALWAAADLPLWKGPGAVPSGKLTHCQQYCFGSEWKLLGNLGERAAIPLCTGPRFSDLVGENRVLEATSKLALWILVFPFPLYVWLRRLLKSQTDLWETKPSVKLMVYLNTHEGRTWGKGFCGVKKKGHEPSHERWSGKHYKKATESA